MLLPRTAYDRPREGVVRAARPARRDRRGSRRRRVPALDHAVEPAGVPPRRGGELLQRVHALDEACATRTARASRSSSARSTTTRARSIRISSQACSRSPARMHRSRAGCPRCSCSRRCCSSASRAAARRGATSSPSSWSCWPGSHPGSSSSAGWRSRSSTQPLLVVLLLLWLERTWRRRALDASSTGVVGRRRCSGCSSTRTRGAGCSGRCSRRALVVFAGVAAGGGCSRRGRPFAVAAPAGRRLRAPPSGCAHRAVRADDDRAGRPLGAESSCEAIGNWFRDANPWHWATAGDPARTSTTAATARSSRAVVALAIAGAVLVLVRQRGISGGATCSSRRCSSRSLPRSRSTGTTRSAWRRSRSSS